MGRHQGHRFGVVTACGEKFERGRAARYQYPLKSK